MLKKRRTKKTIKKTIKKTTNQNEKTIYDFLVGCHCGDPEYYEFMNIRENETLLDYGKRTTPFVENCIVTSWILHTYDRRTNFTLG